MQEHGPRNPALGLAGCPPGAREVRGSCFLRVAAYRLRALSIPDTLWFWFLGLGLLFVETKKVIRLIKSGRIKKSEFSPLDFDGLADSLVEASEYSPNKHGENEVKRRMSKHVSVSQRAS